MNIENIIIQNKLIIVPALIILGYVIKKLKKIPDKYIPLILLIFGVLLSIFTESSFTLPSIVESIIQGVLVTGAAVLGNQIPKQLNKKE